MARDNLLMYVLAAVVIINVIIIVILNNRLADEQALEASSNGVPQTTLGPGDTAAPSGAIPTTGTAGDRGAGGDATGGVPPRTVIRTQPPVRTIVIDAPASCDRCFDVDQYLVALDETINMVVEENGAGADGFPFVPQRLPALAFNGTLAEYTALLEGWDIIGNITNITGTTRYDGTWYILPVAHPPYYDTVSGTTRGVVTVTYLTASTCDGCYDQSVLRDLINDSHIIVGKERTFDIASPEGRAVAARYNITRVPTIIMDEEAGLYPNLLPGWLVVGTIEDDGAYVLRNLERLKVVYYDIASKRVMNP
ncbi:TPA: hypothetical protein HA251_03965 [Candidatus Woesearchaeota archaeon]|nr:hypothetical protein [Candidatus Woesearchaeota archaeon]